jgi:hypothetical protein
MDTVTVPPSSWRMVSCSCVVNPGRGTGLVQRGIRCGTALLLWCRVELQLVPMTVHYSWSIRSGIRIGGVFY